MRFFVFTPKTDIKNTSLKKWYFKLEPNYLLNETEKTFLIWHFISSFAKKIINLLIFLNISKSLIKQKKGIINIYYRIEEDTSVLTQRNPKD